MSSPSRRMTNHPLKGRGQHHMTHFKSWGPNGIFGTAEDRIVKFDTLIDCMKS